MTILILPLLVIQSQRIHVNPETRMKAVFLMNFTQYISWTTLDTAKVFTIGVYGLDEILLPLKQLSRERRSGGQIVNVERVSRAEEIELCEILFVPFAQAESFHKLRPDIPPENILIVGESLGFASSDGAINFVKRDGKIKLEINRKALSDAKLSASSQLLKLAILVGEEEKLSRD
ncbi:MAG: YfiR family protein [Candidatus Marinimicrobia bacterium]|nr:YfiR family protein [Candidatus Neomarinimicrobiota bacterium]